MSAAFNKILGLGLALGITVAGGLFLTGRIGLTTPAFSEATSGEPRQPQPQFQAARPATAAAVQGGTLPDLSNVAERALKASVSITSTVTQQINDPFTIWATGRRAFQQQEAGSGVIVSPDGYVLTNKHVVGSQDAEIKVTLPDGIERQAKIIGIDEVSDLAVVKVAAKNLQTLPWGDSGKLRVAEWVLAVGNPFQLSGTVTLGIVSTVNRSGAQMGAFADFIQTDAAINPGNSGGALVNARGELVGINTMIYSARTGANVGIGFAIPSNMAQSIMQELKDTGSIARGTIGLYDIRDVDATTAAANGLGSTGGVVIMNLYVGSSGVRAGLRRLDLITKVNGQTVTDSNSLLRLIYNAKIGSTLKLEISRLGRLATVDVAVEKLTAGG